MTEDWRILGLEAPTDDLAVVKRAYAARLRLHRPETDPEGFQRLREAYERILGRLRPRPRSAVLDAGLRPLRSPGMRPGPPAPPLHAATVGSDANPPPAPGGEIPFVELDPPPAPQSATPQVLHPDVALDPGATTVRRDLSEEWRSLWKDPDQRRAKNAWNRFLAGDEWLHLPSRRRLEMEILTELQQAWMDNELRWIHGEAWLLLERHFGWLDREMALASIFLDDFVDHLAEEIRRSGRRFDPDRFPSAPVVRKEVFDTAPTEGWRLFPGAIFPILVLLSILIRLGLRGHFDSGEPTNRIPWSDGPNSAELGSRPYMGMSERVDREGRPLETAPPAEPTSPERPVVRLRSWNDETGGILPNTCAGEAIPGEPCPWTDIVQVLRAGREQDARLVLTVGEDVVETLAVELNIAQRLRLCNSGGKDVVAVEEGFDPCASKVAKAWSVDRLRFRPVGTSGVSCDTSQSCRWKSIGF